MSETRTPKERDNAPRTQTTARYQGEQTVSIPLAELHPFPNHPFMVRDDDAMKETVESIKEYGVLTPIIVRPRRESGYEIVSGHRRKRASELAGLDTLPAIIRNLDDDAAVILMVDSNIQRENILPSERARAYKMKMEAIKRQGARTDLTSRQVVAKLDTPPAARTRRAAELIGSDAGESGRQVQRYIRLTELSPQLQQMVDDKKIGFTPAVEISWLKPEEQSLLVETIDSEQATPSLSQARRMKMLSQSGELNEDTMLSIMSEVKKPEKNDLTISGDILHKYFPRSYTPRQMENVIIKLLESWQKKRQRGQER